jgi:hypothetical protein
LFFDFSVHKAAANAATPRRKVKIKSRALRRRQNFLGVPRRFHLGPDLANDSIGSD